MAQSPGRAKTTGRSRTRRPLRWGSWAEEREDSPGPRTSPLVKELPSPKKRPTRAGRKLAKSARPADRAVLADNVPVDDQQRRDSARHAALLRCVGFVNRVWHFFCQARSKTANSSITEYSWILRQVVRFSVARRPHTSTSGRRCRARPRSRRRATRPTGRCPCGPLCFPARPWW